MLTFSERACKIVADFCISSSCEVCSCVQPKSKRRAALQVILHVHLWTCFNARRSWLSLAKKETERLYSGTDFEHLRLICEFDVRSYEAFTIVTLIKLMGPPFFALVEALTLCICIHRSFSDSSPDQMDEFGESSREFTNLLSAIDSTKSPPLSVILI
jgi:hypothetical protein